MAKVRITNIKACVVNLPELSSRRAEAGQPPTEMDRWVKAGILDDDEAFAFKDLPPITLAPLASVVISEVQAQVMVGGFASVEIYEKAGHLEFAQVDDGEVSNLGTEKEGELLTSEAERVAAKKQRVAAKKAAAKAAKNGE